MKLQATVDLRAYGTSEGVKKAWDTRGRKGDSGHGYQGKYQKHFAFFGGKYGDSYAKCKHCGHVMGNTINDQENLRDHLRNRSGDHYALPKAEDMTKNEEVAHRLAKEGW